MQHDTPASPVTIAVSEVYFDPFSSGSGSALRILHADNTISVQVVALQQGVDPCATALGSCFVEQRGHLAVSYTHLDVYKRQAEQHPPTAHGDL